MSLVRSHPRSTPSDQAPARPISRRAAMRLVVYGGLAGCAAKVGHDRWALHITRHEVPLPTLPARLDGLTIAHLTDLHLSPWIPPDYLRRAVAMSNAQRPDVVVVTGDFISQHRNYAWQCGEIVARLEARMGRFATLGNHDHWLDAQMVAEAAETAGLTLLSNACELVAGGLWLAGVDDWWAGQPDLAQALAAIPSHAPVVLLSHNPRGFDHLDPRHALVLSGHTHGGQVAIPGVRRVLPPDMDGTPYVEGWYRRGLAQMYVSRGVGMVFPPVRFRVTPEIALYTLRRGEGEAFRAGKTRPRPPAAG